MPGTFERFLLAGHAAAIAPVGANGEVAYAAAMQPWGLTHRDTATVMRWTLRFKKLYDLKKTNGAVRDCFDAPRTRKEMRDSSAAAAAPPHASNAHDEDLAPAPAVGGKPRDHLATAVVAPTGSHSAVLAAAGTDAQPHAAGHDSMRCQTPVLQHQVLPRVHRLLFSPTS